ncbi:MAG: efflux RND transporter permease subunit [Steroidobacteraceae bacterium]
MNFATWSIRNPIACVVLFAVLTIAGLVGFRALPVKEFPDLDFPTVEVSLRLPGAAPAQLETQVARRVEDALASLEGLKHMSTRIGEGLVTMTIEFRIGRNLSDALIDVKDAVDKTRRDLPQDLEEPTVSKVTVGPGGALVTYAVTSTGMSDEELSWFIDDTVARAVVSVQGVGQFARVGGGTRQVQVQVDPARLDALGITAADVSRALRRAQQEASGGRGQLGGGEQGLRTIATVRQASDLAALPIALADARGGGHVRLDQVADIVDTVADRTQAAVLDGRPAVGFIVRQTKGYDETRIVKGIEQKVAELERLHPQVKFDLISTSVTHAQEQFKSSMDMLYEGALLSMVVVWVFLRNWRATILGAIALPLSIIPTFAFMQWAGYSLNTLTLLALSVVVGILVDDAIVEIENIERHSHMGKSVRAATEDAVNEIGLAVIATTMALVVVFLPTAFMGGSPGLVFAQFGWTAVAAILTSLAVARLITPMAATFVLRPRAAEAVKDGRLMRAYLKGVRWCVDHRARTLVGATVFFIASVALIPLLPTGFIPPGDRGWTVVNIELPPGSSLQATLAAAEEARHRLIDGPTPVPGVVRLFTTVGQAQAAGPSGGAAGGEVRKGSITVVLAERGHRPSQMRIENQMRERLASVPGARFSIGAGSPGEKLTVMMSGRDSARLKAAADALQSQLRGLPYLSSIISTASLEKPEITIRPNPARAAERGVTAQAIAETLRVATSGDFTASLAKLNLDSRQVDISVMMPERLRTDLATISALRVPAPGGAVPIDSVADVSIESGPSQIDRYDRERNVAISADLGGHSIGDALKDAQKLPALQHLPAGVAWKTGNDAEFMQELFAGFGGALMIAVLLIYCVLVLLFKDFFQPVTILSAVPLSIGGAFIALLLGGSEIGLPALIGVVMLLGIVTKNSILLVDYAIIGTRDLGLSEHEALIEACHKRARPIIMTTVAMIAGMLPLALGIGGGDGSFRKPMAIAVIGGLITSTGLSLFVVPAAYTYVSRFERRVRGWARRQRHAADAAPDARPAPQE